MQQAQFNSYAREGYNRIPVFRRVLADLETPLSALRKLAQGPYSFLFESVLGGERWGRYTIIGLPASERIEVRGYSVSRYQGVRCLERADVADPLAWIADYQGGFKVPDVEGLPRVGGGLVGYFGYDTVRYIEPRLAHSMPEDRLGQPDIMLLVADELVVFDNLTGSLYLIVHVTPEQGLEHAGQRLDALEAGLAKTVAAPSLHRAAHIAAEADFESEFGQQGYEAAVDRIKDYIVAGDAMQVVLAQRLSAPYNGDPLDVYRALRHLNPSPYLFYLDMGDFQIVGSSPEILTRVEDGRVTVRPIAGTRPRGQDEATDQALEAELLADPKELAEHLMLIDLGRNDVGRVAEIGSVELTEKMLVERYSHVMHIVSNVQGTLRAEFDALGALRATFPAGTVSGAPKVRAMEIIDELEPVKRGIYAGAVGYLGWNGNMDTAIAIRTAVVQHGRLFIEAGAGIVADSVPRNEWNETMNKARALFRAVALAQKGLRLEG